MSDDQNQIVDLDALTPPSAKVKFGDQEIEIKPPSTADFLRLGYLGQKLEKGGELAPEKLEEAITALTSHIYKLVPELDSKPLNTAQLLALVKLVTKMGMPPDAEELDKRGIGANSPKKAQ